MALDLISGPMKPRRDAAQTGSVRSVRWESRFSVRGPGTAAVHPSVLQGMSMGMALMMF